MADNNSLSQSGIAANNEFSDKPAGGAVRQCPSAGEDNHWIEIQVVDEDGLSVSDVPCSITLPDGNVRESTLDKEGFLRLEGIPGGRCQVRLENIDSCEWSSQPRQSPTPKAEGVAWIEIELKDEEGRLVAGQPYRLTLPSGEVREGTLDENGFAIEKNLPLEACTLSFPDLDIGDFL